MQHDSIRKKIIIFLFFIGVFSTQNNAYADSYQKRYKALLSEVDHLSTRRIHTYQREYEKKFRILSFMKRSIIAGIGATALAGLFFLMKDMNEKRKESKKNNNKNDSNLGKLSKEDRENAQLKLIAKILEAQRKKEEEEQSFSLSAKKYLIQAATLGFVGGMVNILYRQVITGKNVLWELGKTFWHKGHVSSYHWWKNQMQHYEEMTRTMLVSLTHHTRDGEKNASAFSLRNVYISECIHSYRLLIHNIERLVALMLMGKNRMRLTSLSLLDKAVKEFSIHLQNVIVPTHEQQKEHEQALQQLHVSFHYLYNVLMKIMHEYEIRAGMI